VNSIIESKLKEKFSKYDSLSNTQQLEIYNKILSKLTELNNSTTISSKQKTLLEIIQQVINVKKNSLS
jgi:hypothetical protein